jgi:hypothetical protein
MSAAIESLNRDPDLREALQSFWLAADKADEGLIAKCQEVLGNYSIDTTGTGL